MIVDIPGVGGSLGQCVVCGENFVHEILMGNSVDMMNVSGIEANLPLHEKCRSKLPIDGDWEKLPCGPLREEFERANKILGEQVECLDCGIECGLTKHVCEVKEEG